MNDDAQRLSRILNKMKIPAVTDPFCAEIVWLQQQFFVLDGRRINRRPHRHNFCEVHIPTCGSVSTMVDKNKQEYNGELADILAQGYSKCGACKAGE